MTMNPQINLAKHDLSTSPTLTEWYRSEICVPVMLKPTSYGCSSIGKGFSQYQRRKVSASVRLFFVFPSLTAVYSLVKWEKISGDAWQLIFLRADHWMTTIDLYPVRQTRMILLNYVSNVTNSRRKSTKKINISAIRPMNRWKSCWTGTNVLSMI